jgi:hypothetical protein
LVVALAGGLLYAIAYVAFWPRTFTTLDESTYFNMAYTLRWGSLYPDVAGITTVGTYQVGPHMVSKYPLGMPALLALASIPGWSFALGTNLLVHLASFLVLLRLFRESQVPEAFALLFLFHPTAVLYSRTVMADPASGLILLLAFVAVLRGKHLLSGGLLGVAVLFRTANVVALPAFAIACLIGTSEVTETGRARILATSRLVLGTVPPMALALYYAWVVADGQQAAYTGSFSLAHFARMLPAYLIGLTLVFPGMLPSVLVRCRGRAVVILSTAGFLLLYGFWYWRDTGGTILEDVIVGQRYFLAVLPLLVYSYGTMLWRVARRVPALVAPPAFLFVCVILLFGAVAIHLRHGRYLEPLLAVRGALLEATRPNDVVVTVTVLAKLFHPAWGARRLCVTGGALEDVPRLRRCAEETVAQFDGRIMLATWYRAHREDDRMDAAVIDAVAATYPTREVSFVDAGALPPELRLVEVVR